MGAVPVPFTAIFPLIAHVPTPNVNVAPVYHVFAKVIATSAPDSVLFAHDLLLTETHAEPS